MNRLAPRVLLALTSAVALLVASGSARADDTAVGPVAPMAAPATPEDKPSDAPRWYGWQTLTTDGAAVVLGALALASDSTSAQETLGTAAVGAYGLGAPVVHATHGRFAYAGGSLAMRLGGPLAGGLVGLVTGVFLPIPTESIGQRLVVGMYGGAALGAVGASVIDAAVFARESPSRPAKAAHAAPVAPHVVPTFAVTRERSESGVTGARATVGASLVF